MCLSFFYKFHYDKSIRKFLLQPITYEPTYMFLTNFLNDEILKE